METKNKPAFMDAWPRTPKAAFTSQRTHPLLLELLLLQEFGPQYLAWEPETLWLEIRRTWGINPSASARAMIQAIRTCQVVDAPYTDWNVFEKTARAFFGDQVRFDYVQPLTPAELAIFLGNIQMMREVKISDEVYRYCAASMHDAGHVYGVGALSPANVYLRDVFRVTDAQRKARLQYEAGYVPKEVVTSVDLQVAKIIEVVDLVEHDTRKLKTQVSAVLGE